MTPRGPSIAFLLPTGRCNLACQGCYATLEHAGRHQREGELTLDQYRKILDELVALGIQIYDISGGEPFVWPHLVELCRAIRDYEGTRIWLVTNGTLGARSDFAALAPLVERLIISLDAPSAPLHDALRGRAGAFDKTLATIRTARQLPFHEIGVNQLLCRSNADSAVEMLNLCHREGVDRLTLLSLRDVSERGTVCDQMPSLEVLSGLWHALAQRLAQIERPHWLDLVVPAFLYPESSAFRRSLSEPLRRRIRLHHPHLRACSAFRDTLVVKPLGSITGDTAMVNDPFFDMGSAHHSIRETWPRASETFRRRLQAREQRLRCTDPCQSCPRWRVCHGGCPGAARRQWGQAWRHDRSCDAFRAAGCFGAESGHE